jgi:hypothetical protein
VKIGIRIESFAIIKYVVYPQTITYIIYCHAKLQLKVILGSLWVVVGSLYGRCGVVVGSLWVVVGSLWVVVGSLWIPDFMSSMLGSSLTQTELIPRSLGLYINTN